MSEHYMTPQVIHHPMSLPQANDGFGFIPSFPMLAQRVDSMARRVPWWLWIGVTVFVVWKYGKRIRAAA